MCFAHEDGEGFNLLLQALPLDAKLVLRTYKEKPEEQKEVMQGQEVQEVGSVACATQLKEPAATSALSSRQFAPQLAHRRSRYTHNGARVGRRRPPIQLGLALAPALTCCLSRDGTPTSSTTAGLQWACNGALAFVARAPILRPISSLHEYARAR